MRLLPQIEGQTPALSLQYLNALIAQLIALRGSLQACTTQAQSVRDDLVCAGHTVPPYVDEALLFFAAPANGAREVVAGSCELTALNLILLLLDRF